MQKIWLKLFSLFIIFAILLCGTKSRAEKSSVQWANENKFCFKEICGVRPSQSWRAIVARDGKSLNLIYATQGANPMITIFPKQTAPKMSQQRFFKFSKLLDQSQKDWMASNRKLSGVKKPLVKPQWYSADYASLSLMADSQTYLGFYRHQNFAKTGTYSQLQLSLQTKNKPLQEQAKKDFEFMLKSLHALP